MIVEGGVWRQEQIQREEEKTEIKNQCQGQPGIRQPVKR